MKNDINITLNKLVAYAQDNFMLDMLDGTYALNRLAELAGVAPKAAQADYGDSDFASLIAQLKAAAPDIDVAAVTDVLMPLPHTVNYFFNDEFGRNPQKALDFLFELYELCGSVKSSGAVSTGGFSHYTAGAGDRAVMLNVGGDDLKYSPIARDCRVAALECVDFMSEDITAREAAFADEYGMAIAKRIGCDCGYFCCDVTALKSAKVKEKLSGDVVKVGLLDYPVPVLSLCGPKNSAAREAAAVIKAATDGGLKCVCACEPGEMLTFFIVFADAVPATDIMPAGNPLTACGVFATVDFAPLMSVLEKGMALSSDLFIYKPIYTAIGGVKHGAKAAAALSAELVKQFKTALAAAASAEESAVKALVEEK